MNFFVGGYKDYVVGGGGGGGGIAVIMKIYIVYFSFSEYFKTHYFYVEKIVSMMWLSKNNAMSSDHW